MKNNPLAASRIARKLFWRVTGFAAMLIFVFSVIVGGAILYYQKKDLVQRFSRIKDSYLAVVESSLWVADQEQVSLALEGICRMPGIAYAVIRDSGEIRVAAGNPNAAGLPVQKFRIERLYNGSPVYLGDLEVHADAAHARMALIHHILGTFLTHAAAMILVGFVTLFLGYKIVGRRLLMLAHHARHLSPETLDVSLPPGSMRSGSPDELDHLAQILESFRENLLQAFEQRRAVEKKLEEHRLQLEQTVARRTASLQKALDEVRQLSGLLPICSHCKKIRDDSGYWNQLESYIQQHSGARFSHGICPECAEKHYPDLNLYEEE